MRTATSAPPARRRIAAAFRSGPLAVRDFRLLSLGQLASTAGDFCYAVALPWLVLSAHGGAVLLGTVLACYGVPRTVLIPVGGVLADRISPRAVMLAADVVRCGLVAVLAVFAARGLDSIAFLGPVAALIGAGEGVFLPASAAIMPSLLPAESLQAGNGLSAAMIQIGGLTGPVLGAALVTAGGSGAGGSALAFAVDAASFAVSAGALAVMRGHRVPAPTPASEAGAAADTLAGRTVPGGTDAVDGLPGDAGAWRLLLRARVLQVIVLVAVLANFVIAGAFEVALPALAHARYGAPGYGALIACFGVGSLAGTLAAARLGALRRPAVSACAGFLAGAVAVAFVPYVWGLPGAAAAIAAFGAAANFGNVVIVTLLQRWSPAHLLGRVMSLVMLASIGAFPASVALSGLIVHGIGPAPFFPAVGAVLVVTVLLAATQRQFRDFGAAAEPSQAAVVAAR